MKLSQCMIVKNEEKNIERALSWGKGIVSEQIVVDTGSTDCTVEIAEKMGAKVYHFTWINDFSAAKNFAIEQATGDWIAFLDADEYIEEQGVVKLMSVLEKMDTAVVRDENGRPQKIEVIKCQMAHLDAKGQISLVHDQSRFFRNVPYIRYEGAIHEQIQGMNHRDLIILDLKQSLVIYHTGYAWTNELREEKSKRNKELLEHELETKTHTPELLLYMADTYEISGDRKQACEYAQEVLKMETSFSERLRAYLILFYGKADEWNKNPDHENELQMLYGAATAACPSTPDFDVAMGFYMYGISKFRDCISYLERALEKAENEENLLFSRVSGLLKDIYLKLCMCYEELRDVKKSFQYATLVLQIDPYEEAVIYPMLYKLTYVAPAPAEDIMGLLKQLYDLSSRKDTLFLLKNIRKVTNVELEQCLKPYMAIEDQQQFFLPFS